MLKKATESALRRAGGRSATIRSPSSATGFCPAAKVRSVGTLGLYLDGTFEKLGGTSESTHDNAFPKDAFAFDVERESFIKKQMESFQPMWVEQEGPEEIVWRAKVIDILLSIIRNDHRRYQVTVSGVSGISSEPFEILAKICEAALGIDRDEMDKFISDVYRDRKDDGFDEFLFIHFVSQEAKYKFLEAIPTIEQIQNVANDGRCLKVLINAVRNGFDLRFTPFRAVDMNMFNSMDHDDFVFGKNHPDPSYSGMNAAKAWVEHVENRMQDLKKSDLLHCVILHINGSADSYKALNKRELLRVAKRIVSFLVPKDESFNNSIEDISNVTLSMPYSVLSSQLQENSDHIICISFRRRWVAWKIRSQAERFGRIPDPINSGEKLEYYDLDEENVTVSNIDDQYSSLPCLVTRLNRAEARIRMELVSHCRKFYNYYGNQEKLQQILKMGSFEESTEFARRVLCKEFGYEEEIVNSFTVEAGVLEPNSYPYLRPSKYVLQIEFLKGWQAEVVALRRGNLFNRGSFLDPHEGPYQTMMERRARAVQAFLQESGTSAKLFFRGKLPYIMTQNPDGTQTPTLYTRFSLTQEEFNRHAHPMARWAPREADSVVAAD